MSKEETTPAYSLEGGYVDIPSEVDNITAKFIKRLNENRQYLKMIKAGYTPSFEFTAHNTVRITPAVCPNNHPIFYGTGQCNHYQCESRALFPSELHLPEKAVFKGFGKEIDGTEVTING